MGQDGEKRYSRVFFPARGNHLRPVTGAVVLMVLLGLAFVSSEVGRRGEASVAAPSASEPSRDSGLRAESTLLRERLLLARQDGFYGTSQDAHRVASGGPASTCDDLRVLVDGSHALPADYVPADLTSLPASGVPTVGGRGLTLRKEATKHLGSLIEAATADGEELVVASAFRSYADQRSTYERLKSIYGSGAEAMSAPPGHSQHQLGTAVDFTNALAGYQVRPVFGRTSASAWLQEHAPEYGFVLAYPPGRNATRYEFEPWHYRYVGVENAGRLGRSGLVLQTFLVREHVSPHC